MSQGHQGCGVSVGGSGVGVSVGGRGRGVSVTVGVPVGSGVKVGVTVGVSVGGSGVSVGVNVGVGSGVAVYVGRGVLVGVGVGALRIATISASAQPIVLLTTRTAINAIKTTCLLLMDNFPPSPLLECENDYNDRQHNNSLKEEPDFQSHHFFLSSWEREL